MELSRQRFFANTWFSRSNSANFQLALCRRIKLQPDLDELIKQLGGPAPPPLPRGQVVTHLNLEENKNQNEFPSLSGSPTTPCGIRNVGTKGQLHCLCLWCKYLLQVWKKLVSFANQYFLLRETPESLDVMVTQTGRPGVIFNGVADWVYEEEVLCQLKPWKSLSDGLTLLGVVRHSRDLVFPRRWQDRLDPVQRHWRKNISRSLWGWQNLKPNLTGALFQVDVMTITHYGQPGNLQFQYPIQTPLRLVVFFFNLRIMVIVGLLLWNWCFNFPHSFFFDFDTSYTRLTSPS